MSKSVFQPIGQKRLTNIAVVKYKRHGKRFEIACYKNKVINWRNGVEKDLDEVLQTTAVFANVSKGILAKKEDLLLVFGTVNEELICKRILSEGEVQVSDKERKVEFDTLFRDVASILSEKCLNPESNRPYTISILERALHDVHFSVDPKRPAKAQALEALPALQSRFPIERARMRLRLTVPLTSSDEVNDLLSSRNAVIEEQELHGSMISVLCLLDPGSFRAVHALAQSAGAGSRVEVVELAASAAEPETAAGIDSFASLSLNNAPPSAAPSLESYAGANLGENGSGLASQHLQQQDEDSVIIISAAPSAAAAAAAPPPRTTTTTTTTPTTTTTTTPAPSSGSSSGFISSRPLPSVATRRAPQDGSTEDPSSFTVVYPRGPVASLPEEHASRKERFAELDRLQTGWTVELRCRGEGSTVEALFYSPEGQRVGAYAVARRMALQASKQASASAVEVAVVAV